MISGVINVRKEKGMTSFGVIARLRRIFKQKKIGHAGTLDPDAEGVLPVCLGKATRLVETLGGGTKTYEAVMLLGVTTDTQDTTGAVLSRSEVTATEDAVREAVFSFSGKQVQVPPMYSAKKVKGQKLVDLARRGIEVERKGREVEFSGIKILKMELPYVTFRVTCTRGTYIRTLCHDIGGKLGCGAAMDALLRTRVGSFELEDALTLSEIEEGMNRAKEQGSLPDFIMPIDSFYGDLPAVCVPDDLRKAVLNGNTIALSSFGENENIPREGDIRVYLAGGEFAGIYHIENKSLKLIKLYIDVMKFTEAK